MRRLEAKEGLVRLRNLALVRMEQTRDRAEFGLDLWERAPLTESERFIVLSLRQREDARNFATLLRRARDISGSLRGCRRGHRVLTPMLTPMLTVGATALSWAAAAAAAAAATAAAAAAFAAFAPQNPKTP